MGALTDTDAVLFALTVGLAPGASQLEPSQPMDPGFLTKLGKRATCPEFSDRVCLTNVYRPTGIVLLLLFVCLFLLLTVT